MVFLAKSLNIDKDIFYIWNFIKNDIKQLEFNVERYTQAYFFTFSRIAVPFCLSFKADDILGFGTNSKDNDIFKVKGDSGISVYDFDIKLQWKI